MTQCYQKKIQFLPKSPRILQKKIIIESYWGFFWGGEMMSGGGGLINFGNSWEGFWFKKKGGVLVNTKRPGDVGIPVEVNGHTVPPCEALALSLHPDWGSFGGVLERTGSSCLHLCAFHLQCQLDKYHEACSITNLKGGHAVCPGIGLKRISWSESH